MTNKDQIKNPDWVSNPGKFIVAWGIPILALILSQTNFSHYQRFVWPVALLWMGIGCLLNASRCRRRHCFYTGPFFLMLALVSFLHGWNILSFGNKGWFWIGWSALIGGISLIIFPEWVWGKYAKRTY